MHIALIPQTLQTHFGCKITEEKSSSLSAMTCNTLLPEHTTHQQQNLTKKCQQQQNCMQNRSLSLSLCANLISFSEKRVSVCCQDVHKPGTGCTQRNLDFKFFRQAKKPIVAVECDMRNMLDISGPTDFQSFGAFVCFHSLT